MKNNIWIQLGRRLSLLVLLLLVMWALPDFSNGKKRDDANYNVDQLETITLLDAQADNKREISFVEKLNASIDEQVFLFSTIQNERSNERSIDQILLKLESNLLEVEKLAQEKGVEQLIDFPAINGLKEKIALFRKNA